MTEATRQELRKRAQRVVAAWLRDRLWSERAQDKVDELHGLTAEERTFVLEAIEKMAAGHARLGGSQ